MKMRLPFVMIALLGSGLSLAAWSVRAEEPSGTPPSPPGMGKGMGKGMGMDGGMGMGGGMGMDRRGPPHPRFSAADRAAFFDAHLAGLHAGLELTPDQEKLWPPVEAALRAGAKAAAERFEKAHGEARPADAIAWLRKLSEDDISKGETLKALADAAAPLYQSLTEEQKHRVPFLMHGIRPHAFGPLAAHGGRDDHEDHDEDREEHHEDHEGEPE